MPDSMSVIANQTVWNLNNTYESKILAVEGKKRSRDRPSLILKQFHGIDKDPSSTKSPALLTFSTPQLLPVPPITPQPLPTAGSVRRLEPTSGNGFWNSSPTPRDRGRGDQELTASKNTITLPAVATPAATMDSIKPANLNAHATSAAVNNTYAVTTPTPVTTFDAFHWIAFQVLKHIFEVTL